jgi:ElaB/YqjD/DUF883 family membrane-anchored ribosome-binding protein
MSTPDQLHRQAAELTTLAESVENLLRVPRRMTDELIGTKRWAGPQAERIRDDIHHSITRLRSIADQLRAEAGNLIRQANQIGPHPYGGPPQPSTQPPYPTPRPSPGPHG